MIKALLWIKEKALLLLAVAAGVLAILLKLKTEKANQLEAEVEVAEKKGQLKQAEKSAKEADEDYETKKKKYDEERAKFNSTHGTISDGS